jgi:hypothetical protein
MLWIYLIVTALLVVLSGVASYYALNRILAAFDRLEQQAAYVNARLDTLIALQDRAPLPATLQQPPALQSPRNSTSTVNSLPRVEIIQTYTGDSMGFRVPNHPDVREALATPGLSVRYPNGQVDDGLQPRVPEGNL